MIRSWMRVMAVCVSLGGAFASAPAAAHSFSEQGSYTLTLYAVKGTPYDSDAPFHRIASGTLRCGPDGGSHRAPRAACDDLRAANGFIDLVPEASGPCSSENAPVYAVAEGRWKGEPRLFGKVFSNRCIAVRSTGGAVFRI